MPQGTQGKNPTSAGGSSAGFYFQLLRTVEIFLQPDPPDRLLVEAADDLETIRGSVRTLEQLKHSLRPDTEFLTVGDFLKTLSNRTSLAAGGKLFASDKLILFKPAWGHLLGLNETGL